MSNLNENDRSLLEEVRWIIDRAYRRIRLDQQHRRLQRALRILGISQIVGDSWASIDEENIEIRFNPIPKDRLAILVEHLVDLSEIMESRTNRRTLVSASQLRT